MISEASDSAYARNTMDDSPIKVAVIEMSLIVSEGSIVVTLLSRNLRPHALKS